MLYLISGVQKNSRLKFSSNRQNMPLSYANVDNSAPNDEDSGKPIKQGDKIQKGLVNLNLSMSTLVHKSTVGRISRRWVLSTRPSFESVSDELPLALLTLVCRWEKT